jgi:hypothetical protein
MIATSGRPSGISPAAAQRRASRALWCGKAHVSANGGPSRAPDYRKATAALAAHGREPSLRTDIVFGKDNGGIILLTRNMTFVVVSLPERAGPRKPRQIRGPWRGFPLRLAGPAAIDLDMNEANDRHGTAPCSYLGPIFSTSANANSLAAPTTAASSKRPNWPGLVVPMAQRKAEITQG